MNDTHPRKTPTRKKSFRLSFIAAALLSAFAFGCAAQIAGQEVRIRPGRRVPDRIVQHGDQEDVVIEGIREEQKAVLLIVRGSF